MTSFKISKDIIDDNITGLNTLQVPIVSTFPAVNQPGNIVLNTGDNTFYGLGATEWVPLSGATTPLDGFMGSTSELFLVSGATTESIFFSTDLTENFIEGLFDGRAFTAGVTGIYNINVSVTIASVTDGSFILSLALNGSNVLGTSQSYDDAPGRYTYNNNLRLNANSIIDVVYQYSGSLGALGSRYFSVVLVKEL